MLSWQQAGAAFGLGIIATSAPCVFPLYPGFIAYLSSTSGKLSSRKAGYVLGPLVLAGVLTMMLATGLIVASLGIALGNFLAIATPFVDLVIITLGILLLLNINLFTRLPQICVPIISNPYVSAYIYGLLYGPVVLPCSGPVAVGIFALSFSVGQFFEKMALFLVFGLGFGIPLLVLSLVTQIKGAWLTRFFAERHALMNRIAGIILVLLGLWDLHTNLPALRLYF